MAALRYLENRKDQLHYKEALDGGLPIESGTIESGHKHVLQVRLKKAGAAWLEETLNQWRGFGRLRQMKRGNPIGTPDRPKSPPNPAPHS